MEGLEAYAPVVGILGAAFLLIAAGLAKTQLFSKRPAPVRALRRRRSS